MTKKKTKETPVKEKVVELEVESEARQAFRRIIEAYKVKFPEKYELRKAELQAKLDAIK